MRIEQRYLQEYLHDIAVRQLTAQYQSKGYNVAEAQQVGGTQADLVAKKADEVVVLEIKVGKMSPEKKERIAKLSDFVRTQKNYKLLVIVSTPPKPKRIEIPNIDALMADYFFNYSIDELDELSSHTRIENVSDCTVDELTVLEEGFRVRGTGVVEVELNYGPSNDTHTHYDYDSFSFTFDTSLEHGGGNELIIKEMHELIVDTSSFYE
jgi:Holliday junction resolvase